MVVTLAGSRSVGAGTIAGNLFNLGGVVAPKPPGIGSNGVYVGTLTVRQIEPEADGPCRDINYDPTVLPTGITTSDDPFPAARSAAYAVSYDSRTAESAQYPRTTVGAKQ